MGVKTTNRDHLFRDDEKIKANKCSLCGDTDADAYFQTDGYVICDRCAEQMDIQDILDLFGFEDVPELLTVLCGNEV